jgi:hypothetical protein
MTASAVPHTKLALVMPLSAAFARASSIADATLSTPTTAATWRASVSPMVPVPQHTSSSRLRAPTDARRPSVW